jgi:hypothetical protein
VIAFASLFLGLFFGVVDVQLVAADTVASIQLVLDGRPLCDLREPPWGTRIDLGLDLAPHELVAIATDGKGKEVGRTRQWINKPRAEAEAFFVLEPGKGGAGRRARLTWQSAGREDPVSIVISFDGKPLMVTDPGRIEIPAYVPEQVHFLRAEIEFSRGVSAVADVLVGGPQRDESLTNLTAAAILVDKGAKPPRLEELASFFVKDAVALRPVALEEGPGEVVFVVTRAARLELARLETFGGGSAYRGKVLLRKGQSFRAICSFPSSTLTNGMTLNAFATSQSFTSAGRGLARVLLLASRWLPTGAPELVGNAVGLAGIAATGRDRRRVVVLLLGAEEEDESPLAVAHVRAFLKKLRVPLFVWSLVADPTPLARKWGAAEDVSTNGHFDSAVLALSRFLDRQRIVWVEGTHLPQQIELAANVKGFRLAE